MIRLAPSERYLLEWLSQGTFNIYHAAGECYGRDLDTLLEAGLAEVTRPSAMVTLTQAGHLYLLRARRNANA